MAVTGAVLSLVLEFDISVVSAPLPLAIVHARDVLALRLTNRRPLGSIEVRVDLYLARGGRGYFNMMRFDALYMGRFYMGFLRAILRDFVGPEPIMRSPPLVPAFRENEDQAQDAEETARLRIFSALERGVVVNVEDDSDMESVQDEEEEEEDEVSDFGSYISDTTCSTMDGSHLDYPLESVVTQVSTEVSMENNADDADLVDLEGFDDSV
jgi:hypothetical protein